MTVPFHSTIADGIDVKRAGDLTFPIIDTFVDDIVTVSESEIAHAVLVLLEREKTLVEGAIVLQLLPYFLENYQK